jgi:hypothetical protein
VADLEERSLLGAIKIATDGFLEELRRTDPALADRLEPPLQAVIAASIESARQG